MRHQKLLVFLNPRRAETGGNELVGTKSKHQLHARKLHLALLSRSRPGGRSAFLNVMSHGAPINIEGSEITDIAISYAAEFVF
jgi:hypothetical protein